MAYARGIERTCGYGACTKPATHEVLDVSNASYGTFCRTHADALIRKLKAEGL
jgi:hypothetical protein